MGRPYAIAAGRRASWACHRRCSASPVFFGFPSFGITRASAQRRACPVSDPYGTSSSFATRSMRPSSSETAPSPLPMSPRGRSAWTHPTNGRRNCKPHFTRPRPIPRIRAMLSRSLPAGFVPPCLPTKAPTPPSGELWLHEINTAASASSPRRTARGQECVRDNPDDRDSSSKWLGSGARSEIGSGALTTIRFWIPVLSNPANRCGGIGSLK
jgi:hypothetical protein